jgi:hypothetical protein
MWSGGATIVANVDIDSRLYKRHGGWCSNSARIGYVADSQAAEALVRHLNTQSFGMLQGAFSVHFFSPI